MPRNLTILFNLSDGSTVNLRFIQGLFIGIFRGRGISFDEGYPAVANLSLDIESF